MKIIAQVLKALQHGLGATADELAWVLFVVTLLIVTLQVRGSRRLVYTDSGQ